MDIRQARVDDDVALARLHVASWRAAYRGLVPSTFLDSLKEEPRRLKWRTFIEKQDSELPQVFVALKEDAIRGFVRVGRARESDLDKSLWGEIEALYVHPDCWGSGYGKSLLNTATDTARTAGLSRLILWVLVNNQRARSFYEHFGWEPEGSIKTDTTNGFPLHETRYYLAL